MQADADGRDGFRELVWIGVGALESEVPPALVERLHEVRRVWGCGRHAGRRSRAGSSA